MIGDERESVGDENIGEMSGNFQMEERQGNGAELKYVLRLKKKKIRFNLHDTIAYCFIPRIGICRNAGRECSVLQHSGRKV